MWIRSQKKDTLCNVKDVYFCKCNYLNKPKYYEFRSDNFGVSYYVLGTYSSEEKAIKVLDMIQNEIYKLKQIDYPTSKDTYAILGYCYNQEVFQMPQDSEVE